MSLWHLARASLWNRRITALLTALTIAVSVAVILGVQHIRTETRASFGKTVSGVDLIVGARTGQLNLLLYSVFRIGSATNNVSWESYEELAADPRVAWTIPVSLGDSHRGYPVMGTSEAYFEHFRFGQGRTLEWTAGRPFSGTYEAVLGAEVARQLGYGTGTEIVLSHGMVSTSFSRHDDYPFTVVGVLEPTGTPVDRTVHVSLAGIEAIHRDWPGYEDSYTVAADGELVPASITAFMVGLESRMATFDFQRHVNDYRQEPLLAILPGVALAELWQMMALLENVLALIAALVLVSALLGMMTMLLASMREREREIAVLRAIGAPASTLFLLIEIEALLITLVGVLIGVLGLQAALLAAQSWVGSHFGLYIEAGLFGTDTLFYAGMVVLAAMLLATVPSWQAYRRALHQSLGSVR